MYEFEVDGWDDTNKYFAAKCTSSYTDTIKIGEMRAILPEQITIKLGDNGKKFPL